MYAYFYVTHWLMKVFKHLSQKSFYVHIASICYIKRIDISLALYETWWYRDYIGSETNLAIYTEIAENLLRIFYILRIIYIYILYIYIAFLKILIVRVTEKSRVSIFIS